MQMSEQVQEAAIKSFKQAQARYSRLMSPEQTILDVMNHLTLTSDPYLAIQYGTMDRKKKKQIQFAETLHLLEEENSGPGVAEEIDNIIREAEEVDDAVAQDEEQSIPEDISFRDLSLAWGEKAYFVSVLLKNISIISVKYM